MSHAESTQAHSALVSARERWTESMKEEKTRKSGARQGPVKGSVSENSFRVGGGKRQKEATGWRQRGKKKKYTK